jgi:hypothetical protein
VVARGQDAAVTVQVTAAGIRDGDPAVLNALVARRGFAVLAFCEQACPPAQAVEAAADAFARFRATVLLTDRPTELHPEAALLAATRRAVAARLPALEQQAPTGLGRLLGGSREQLDQTRVAELAIGRTERLLTTGEERELDRLLDGSEAARSIEAWLAAGERAYHAAERRPLSAPVGAQIVATMSMLSAGETGANGGGGPDAAAPGAEDEGEATAVTSASGPVEDAAPLAEDAAGFAGFAAEPQLASAEEGADPPPVAEDVPVFEETPPTAPPPLAADAMPAQEVAFEELEPSATVPDEQDAAPGPPAPEPEVSGAAPLDEAKAGDASDDAGAVPAVEQEPGSEADEPEGEQSAAAQVAAAAAQLHPTPSPSSLTPHGPPAADPGAHDRERVRRAILARLPGSRPSFPGKAALAPAAAVITIAAIGAFAASGVFGGDEPQPAIDTGIAEPRALQAVPEGEAASVVGDLRSAAAEARRRRLADQRQALAAQQLEQEPAPEEQEPTAPESPAPDPPAGGAGGTGGGGGGTTGGGGQSGGDPATPAPSPAPSPSPAPGAGAAGGTSDEGAAGGGTQTP